MTRLILLVELGLALAMLLVVFGHAGWASLSARRRRATVSAAEQALAEALDANSWPGIPADLTRLRRREQTAVLLAVAPSLRGQRQDLLRGLADDVGISALAARLCRGRRWWRRLEGARLFTALGGGQRLMLALLADPREEVRAQAVEWVAAHPTPVAVERLVDMLEDPKTTCRVAVKQALIKLSTAAGPAVRRRLEAGNGPLVELLEVGAWSSDPAYLAPVLRLASSPDASVRAAALRLLGALGGPEVVTRATTALRDPTADVRAAAARALGRGMNWSAAPALGERLRDPAWDVRREAGLALSKLGAPGRMVLRRALTDDDAFAADMARLVLDVPAARQTTGYTA